MPLTLFFNQVYSSWHYTLIAEVHTVDRTCLWIDFTYRRAFLKNRVCVGQILSILDNEAIFVQFCSFFSVQKWIPLNEERTVTTPEQKHAGCVRLFCKHSTDRCWNPFISSTALACIKALSSPTITVKAFPFVLSFSPSCFVSCV